MAQDALVSIVIPFYNVERYLPLCLRSVVGQTYENLQIICVDDESTDGSAEVVRSFMDADARIQLVECEHGGVSRARNAGLDACRGEYVMFVDSDDAVSSIIVEEMVAEAVSSQADMVMCDYVRFESDDEARILESENPCDVCRCSGVEAYKEAYRGHNTQVNVIWGKLYRAGLLSGIRYPEGFIHEDEFVTYKTFIRAEKVSILDCPMVFYRQRPGSIMEQSLSEKNLVALDAFQERLEMFLQIGDEELVSFAADYYIAYISWFYADLNSPELRNMLVRRYKAAFKEYGHCLPMSARLRRMVFLLFPNLFTKMYRSAAEQTS